jgi:hypothetical protein
VHLFLKVLSVMFVAFSSIFTVVGFLMLVAPSKYPALYAGFVRESVISRETTQRGKHLAIRLQGLIALTGGAFFGFFIWAFRF